MPFVLPLLRIAAASPKTRSETNPSLSSAKRSCGFTALAGGFQTDYPKLDNKQLLKNKQRGCFALQHGRVGKDREKALKVLSSCPVSIKG